MIKENNTEQQEKVKDRENHIKKSYKCKTCGGWIDYTEEICHGLFVVKHRNKIKGRKCEKLRNVNYKTERANKLWDKGVLK